MIELRNWQYTLPNLLALSEDDAKSLLIDYHWALETAKGRIYELEEQRDAVVEEIEHQHYHEFWD